MMKANELRLHNRISITEKARKELWECEMDVDPLTTGFITSIDIDQCRILLDSMEYEMYFNDLEPIPLTEEWLLKYGFEKSEATESIDTWSNHSIAINTYSKEKVGFYWLRWYQHPNQSRIKYVHQLQNLYFTLTGEELTLKTEL